jgi:hypothetical protein
MLGKIWQWLVGWFRRLFGTGRKTNSTLTAVDRQPLPALDDTDYEYLFMQLLEGVAHGWPQGRVFKFFDTLKDRSTEAQWVEWLHRFGERLLASPVQNNELAVRMIQLGQLGCGEVSNIAYATGSQLLTRGNGQPMEMPIYPELEETSELDLIESEIIEYEGPDAFSSEPPQPGEVQTLTLDELLVLLQQDPNLVQQLAQQLQIETTDPHEIIQTLVNQFQSANQASVDEPETNPVNTDEAEAWNN